MAPNKRRVDDLTRLSDLDDQIVLAELKARYEQGIIYTYIGDILLSVNPNQQLPIYGEQIGQHYGELKQQTDFAPHIYAMATKTYQNLIRSRVNQILLVSGESGAGKTEASKMLVAQVVRISKSSNFSKLHEQIIEVNPLLEAFGNAKTVMNDNSSRFGKLIEIHFDHNGVIIGAKITEHMLEKSRVVKHGQGERSFHIFYSLFAGLSENERRRFYLGRPEDYRIVGSPFGYGSPVFLNGTDFQIHQDKMIDLKQIMTTLKFSNKDMDLIFALISGILHLCNVEFHNDPETDQVIILNEDEVDYASALLCVEPIDLVNVLLCNTTFIRGERVVSIKSVIQANDGRDALAKSIYSKLFGWLIQQINDLLHDPVDRNHRHHHGRSKISILDMAGFENFPVNSLEQLCINIANEQLQYYFNSYVFSWELKEYEAEGLKQPKIKYSNNRHLLDLFLQRPMGFFLMLEDECRLSNTSDLLFVDKLNKQFHKEDIYTKSKAREPVFTIHHFAGKVLYRAEGFIEKNRETLSSNLQSLMENSQHALINELFHTKLSDSGTLKRGQSSRREQWSVPGWDVQSRPSGHDTLTRQATRHIMQERNRGRPLPNIPSAAGQSSSATHTVSSQFRSSLSKLMEKLWKSEPHFIRCFKANNYQRPDEFDSKLMMEQLHSTGVLETVKIRKLGYPTRLPFREFIKRYKFIAYPLTAYVDENEKTCYNILCAAGLGDSEIGKTKVFLKFWQSDRLNLILDDNYSDIVTVQRMVRGYLARRRARYLYRVYRKQKDAVFDLGQTVYDRGHKYFHMMISSSDHDRNSFRAKQEERRRMYNRHAYQGHSPRPDYYSPHIYNRNYDNYDNRYEYMSTQGNNPSRIYDVALRQTLNKLQNIENDVWCKLIYMEYYKPVAKFYIVEREITVDGHYDEFDGENISLGVYHNPERDGIVEGVRKGIGKGLKIHKDYEGNVVVTRLGKNKIYIKDYKDPANHCFGADVLEQLGELNQNKPVKIFDTEEFKCQIGLEMKSRGHIDKRKLQNMCIMGISFIHDTEDPTLTPCWLMLINLSAIDMLDNPEVKNQIEQKFVELTLKDEEEKESEMMKVEAAERINKAAKENMQPGRKWSKLNQRKGLSSKEEPLRKTRLEIIHRGGSLEDHMSYSWDEQNYASKNKQLNMQELKEEYEYFEQTESVIGGYLGPRPSGRRVGAQSVMSSIPVSGISSSHRRQWAKLEACIREESREEGEAIMKAKLEEFDDD